MTNTPHQRNEPAFEKLQKRFKHHEKFQNTFQSVSKKFPKKHPKTFEKLTTNALEQNLMSVPPQKKPRSIQTNTSCQQGATKIFFAMAEKGGSTRRSKVGVWLKNDKDHQILNVFHEFSNFSSYRFWFGACSRLTHKILCMFSEGNRFEIHNDKLDLLTKSFVASSGTRFEIHNDNFIHKILCGFQRRLIWDTQR